MTTNKMMMNSYAKFGVMIGVSTVIMYGLMFLNTYEASHIYFSETRAYMALIMGATMAVIMLLSMMNMYPKKKPMLAF